MDSVEGVRKGLTLLFTVAGAAIAYIIIMTKLDATAHDAQVRLELMSVDMQLEDLISKQIAGPQATSQKTTP